MYYYKQTALEEDTLTIEDQIELQMVILTMNSANHEDPCPFQKIIKTWTSEE